MKRIDRWLADNSDNLDAGFPVIAVLVVTLFVVLSTIAVGWFFLVGVVLAAVLPAVVVLLAAKIGAIRNVRK